MARVLMMMVVYTIVGEEEAMMMSRINSSRQRQLICLHQKAPAELHAILRMPSRHPQLHRLQIPPPPINLPCRHGALQRFFALLRTADIPPELVGNSDDAVEIEGASRGVH